MFLFLYNNAEGQTRRRRDMLVGIKHIKIGRKLWKYGYTYIDLRQIKCIQRYTRSFFFIKL